MAEGMNALVRRTTARLLGLYYGVRPRPKLDPAATRRVLLLRNDVLGDAVVLAWIAADLKALNPAMELHVLGSEKNAFFLERDPVYDRVFTWITKKDKSGAQKRANLRTLRALRAVDYDAVLDLVHFRLRESNPCLAHLAGRRALVSGFGKNLFPHLAFHRFAPQNDAQDRHVIEEMRLVLENTFVYPAGFSYPRPRLVSPPESAARVEAFLGGAGIARFLAVNIFAGEAVREYPLSLAAEFIRGALDLLPGRHVLCTAPPGDAARLNDLVGLVHRERCLAFPPSPDVYDLSELLARSEAVVSPDTSVAHLAAAWNRPVLGLYRRLGNKEFVWRPYCDRFRLLVADEMREIAPTQALAALKELMGA